MKRETEAARRRRFVRLIGDGEAVEAACEALGLSPELADRWLSREKTQEELRVYLERKLLTELTPRAVRVYAQQLQDGEERLRAAAAKDVLSRVELRSAEKPGEVTVKLTGGLKPGRPKEEG